MHWQEKIGELRNCGEMEGGPDRSISLDRDNEMNLEVLNIDSSRAEAEIFEATNDPFNACEDYLLGVIQETECWNDILGITNHDMHEISNNKYEDKILIEDNCMSFPTSFAPGEIDYLENVSSFLQESISSDNNDEGSIFTPALTSNGPICMSTIEQNKELSVVVPNVDDDSSCLQESSTKRASKDSNCEALQTRRRVRKPTRRYIDESEDLNTRRVRKKVEVSTSQSKCQRVKYGKKHNEPLALVCQPEETLCEAIQVPFGPLVSEECHSSGVVKVKSNQILSCDNKHVSELKKVKLTPLSSFGPEKCNKLYEFDMNDVKSNKMAKFENMSRPEECDYKHMSNVKKANQNHVSSSFGSKECVKSPTSDVEKVLKSDEEMSMDEAEDDSVTTLRSDREGARRKHHRLWTVSEVRKLIDGVSQCGVGRWSQIKKLLFASSDHRTPVDLKDKWRNLLKASHLQNQSKKAGKGKQNFSWRPLPKPILHRVTELASFHPYPRNCKSKA